MICMQVAYFRGEGKLKRSRYVKQDWEISKSAESRQLKLNQAGQTLGASIKCLSPGFPPMV